MTGTLPVLATPAAVAVPGEEARGLVAGWLLALAECSEHTRMAYTRDLGQWLDWLAAHQVDPLQARRGHVDAWRQTLTCAGRAPATVARKLSAVSSWYGYAVAEGVIPVSPVALVLRPQVRPDRSGTGVSTSRRPARCWPPRQPTAHGPRRSRTWPWSPGCAARRSAPRRSNTSASSMDTRP